MPPLFVGWSHLSLLDWEISNGLSRIAVPCFFILNGYFLSNKIGDWNYVKKYIKRFCIIYLVWVLVYISFDASIGEIPISSDAFKTRLLLVLLGYRQLWYIIALMEAVLILYLIYRFRLITKTSIQISLIIGLVILGYLIQTNFLEPDSYYYRNTILGLPHLYYYRNVIFVGLPFIWMGIIIKKEYSSLKKAPKNILLLVLSLALVILLIEAYNSYVLCMARNIHITEISISLIVICPVLCLLVLIYSKEKKVCDDFFGQLSSCIYYIHPMVIGCASFFPAEINMFLKLPLVMFIILMMSFVIIEINKKIKIFL